LVPPEITTQNRKDSTVPVPTEPTNVSVKEPTTVSVIEPTTVSVKEPNKVVKKYGHKTTVCKQGEYSPSNYCHKVSYKLKIIHQL